MSTLYKTVALNNNIEPVSSKINKKSSFQNKCRHVLKSKENILKSKYDRALKRKLKKYKLRKDGQEDQDILDISQSFLAHLCLRSPNKCINISSDVDNLFDLRPKNYLSKMVKRQHNSQSKMTDIRSRSDELCEPKRNGAIVNETTTSSPDKKHTDAFSIMMHSRNKSLGSNSPAKEKIEISKTDMQERVEKNNIKAKRKLLLQIMAESKGALKNREKDTLEEECIKTKMQHRANRLKKMLTKEDSNKANNKKLYPKICAGSSGDSSSKNHDIPSIRNTDEVKKERGSKILQLINLFDEPIEIPKISSKSKIMSNEDAEFLKKLSPSIRRKENMLSYFQKIDKGTATSLQESCLDAADEDDDAFQVKMTSKSIKKKRKLSLNKHDSKKSNHNSKNEQITEILVNNQKESSKKLMLKTNNENNNKPSQSISGRPKRCVKRPIKYGDEFQISSSDEELHIITPKKKKRPVLDSNMTVSKIEAENSTQTRMDLKNNTLTSKPKKNAMQHTQKKQVKLAPIFNKKFQQGLAADEAKKKFLQSGVPECLKKNINKQRDDKNNDGYICFQKVVHIQQINTTKPYTSSTYPTFEQNDTDDEKDHTEMNQAYIMKSLLCLSNVSNGKNDVSLSKSNAQLVLQNLKKAYPQFPVYRTYRLLRGKRRGECVLNNLDNSTEVSQDFMDADKDNSNSLCWIDKYRAMSTEEILGNFEPIKELKTWLMSWTENETLVKKKKIISESDSSDYFQSDTDSRDSWKTTNNLFTISGPVGSGKTSCVYAVAAELAIKVIEVNASSKRTGKIMVQDLQEATQSHKVNRSKCSTENSQNSAEINNIDLSQKSLKKRGRPKKNKNVLKEVVEYTKNELLSSQPSSQENTRMSLILIDDADIVFEQDDGFCSAITQLVQCSKRPVILITQSLTCSHLQKFIHYGKHLKMNPLLPRILGTWLDILSLADTGFCQPGIGAKVLDFFEGDIRKSINYLQYYNSSHNKEALEDEDGASQNNSDDFKMNVDEENSCMSWIDSEEKNLNFRNSNDTNDVFKNVLSYESDLRQLTCPVELLNVWWSLPKLLNFSSEEKSVDCAKEQRSCTEEFDSLVDALDSISISAYISCSNKKDITSQPWHSSESDSVSELENLDGYCSSRKLTEEISHFLVTKSIIEAQKTLGCENQNEVHFPGVLQQREKHKTVSRHNELSVNVSPASLLDRRALALDYWSCCRTICRIEKNKSDNNSKRNNRFCSYLKSSKMGSKNELFDKLASTLYTNE